MSEKKKIEIVVIIINNSDGVKKKKNIFAALRIIYIGLGRFLTIRCKGRAGRGRAGVTVTGGGGYHDNFQKACSKYEMTTYTDT